MDETIRTKATAHDRIAEVVNRLDSLKQIDMDALVEGLGDIRDLIVRS